MDGIPVVVVKGPACAGACRAQVKRAHRRAPLGRKEDEVRGVARNDRSMSGRYLQYRRECRFRSPIRLASTALDAIERGDPVADVLREGELVALDLAVEDRIAKRGPVRLRQAG